MVHYWQVFAREKSLFNNKMNVFQNQQDDMGLGKTIQTIALAWTLMRQGPRGLPGNTSLSLSLSSRILIRIRSI